MKICYIVAGPNGAEKTTFARTYHPKEAECLNLINHYRELVDQWFVFDGKLKRVSPQHLDFKNNKE